LAHVSACDSRYLYIALLEEDVQASPATALASAPATPMLGVPNSFRYMPAAVVTQGMTKIKMKHKVTGK
jgi:hypothetical protein